MQVLGGLISLIGAPVFQMLSAPDLTAEQPTVIWRVGAPFVLLAVVVGLPHRVP